MNRFIITARFLKNQMGFCQVFRMGLFLNLTGLEDLLGLELKF